METRRGGRSWWAMEKGRSGGVALGVEDFDGDADGFEGEDMVFAGELFDVAEGFGVREGLAGAAEGFGFD